jgi:hypothetical protein
LNLYVYVSNNPLKYIDPAGHVKVYPVNMSLPHDEIDILSPIKGTYQNKGVRLQVVGELVVGLVGNKNATATQAKKETTAVACVTTVPDTKLLG